MMRFTLLLIAISLIAGANLSPQDVGKTGISRFKQLHWGDGFECLAAPGKAFWVKNLRLKCNAV